MARGVEIRMPFMDHRIVSYAFSLPWQSKVRNGYTKSIVRDAVADLMPQDVAYRKTKIGFNAPMVDWFKGPMRNFFNEIQSSKNFKDCNLIEPISVTRNIENIITDPNATFHQAEHAWQMLTPFLWQEGFLNRITK
jgi:asparagine synthase (glutamine-hydrolysing)